MTTTITTSDLAAVYLNGSDATANLIDNGFVACWREYVAEQYDKTLRFWELISARDGFECLCRPETNISASVTGETPRCRWRSASAYLSRAASSSARPRCTASAGCG